MNLISQANQARTYYRPIWLRNFCGLWDLANRCDAKTGQAHITVVRASDHLMDKLRFTWHKRHPAGDAGDREACRILAEAAEELDCERRSVQLALLSWFAARLGNKWLDDTIVKGNPDAERSALILYRLMRRIAHWDQLVEPFGGLAETIKLHKRLSGILKV